MLILSTASLLLAVSALPAATYDWTGNTSTSWALAANWNAGSVPATNTTQASRLNVASLAVPAARTLVYDASLGTTVYGGSGIRGLVIGSSASTVVNGTFDITGGTFSTAGDTGSGSADILGNGGSGNATLILDGGNYISGAHGLSMGLNNTANGTLTMNSGSATITNTLAVFNYNSTINLNGGILAVQNISYPAYANGLPYVNYNFNGGTLKALANSTVFFPVSGAATVQSASVRNGGAIFDSAGFNIEVDQPLYHSTVGGDAVIDGGLTKNGAGTLTMTGVNTYTGPTIVNGGILSEPMPTTSSSLAIASGAGLSLSTTPALWPMAAANLTNANLTFSYGSFPVNNFNQPNLTVTNLTLAGTTTINISGQNLTVGAITLLTYLGKTGGGSFALGTLPSGAAGNLTDDGANVVLHITTGSAQSLVWSAGDAGFWQTNGALLNWNSGTAIYTEYSPSSSDLVTFDDTSSGNPVNIAGTVKPSSLTVNNSSSSYVFSGSGTIAGSVGIAKLGTGTLQINNSNSFTGPVTISGGSGTAGGTIYVNNPKALGAANGGVTVAGPANTLEIGINGGGGIAVSNKSVTITGAGVGGVNGALCGAATVSGSNVWAGAVILGANLGGIGTEASGNLTVSGAIKDNGANYNLLLTPGSGGSIMIAGTGSSYAGTRVVGDGTGVIKLGLANALSTNALQLGAATVDCNGQNQTLGGISDASGSGTILNNGTTAGTLTINTGTNSYSSSVSLQNGSSVLNLVKSGGGSQTLSGATLSYTGTTVISGGTLNLTSSGTLASAITVQGGATLSGQATTTGSLTLNANSIILGNASAPGVFTAGTVIATASPINVSLSGYAPAPGADVLILKATGGISGSAANFQPYGLRGGTFYLANGNTELHYVAPASNPAIIWKGNSIANPTYWDIATTTNWNNAGNPDKFYTADNVVFDDTASSFTVAIQGASVSPGSVVFSNTANAYTISGGLINGAASLVKNGTNTVTLVNANSYSGGTTLNTNSGAIIADSTSALGSGPVTVDPGSVLSLMSGSTGSTSWANALNGAGTVQLYFPSPAAGNTYLPGVANFSGNIQLANAGNTGDKFNANGISATNVNVQVLSASTLYISQAATLNTVSVVGIGNNEGRGAIRIDDSLTANITLAGNATIGMENPFTGINGTINGTAAAGNTNILTLGSPADSNPGGILNGVISDGASGGKLALSQTAGTVTLTATNTYTGNTTVAGSTLLLSGNASILNTPVINLINGTAKLDVSGVSFSLGSGQTLQGIGLVSGDVLANGTVAPGSPMGTLTISGNLNIAGNLQFNVNKGLVASNSLLSVSGILTNSGAGTLLVQNVGVPALTNGDTFTLFSQPVMNGNALTIAGPAGVTFTNNLAVDGSITVLSVAPPVSSNPTSITATASGHTLNLSWPPDHLGWILQTNSVNVANTNFWFAYPGSASLTNVAIAINPAPTNVFFRLAHP